VFGTSRPIRIYGIREVSSRSGLGEIRSWSFPMPLAPTNHPMFRACCFSPLNSLAITEARSQGRGALVRTVPHEEIRFRTVAHSAEGLRQVGYRAIRSGSTRQGTSWSAS
jgi:hypothetical protein